MNLFLLLSSAGYADVVINEVLINPSGTDTGHEWIEIYNNGTHDVDIGGWELQAGNSSFATKDTIPAGTILPPDTYYLIGEADVAVDIGITPNLITVLNLGNGSASIDGIRLFDPNFDPSVFPNGVKDTVLYGDPATIGSWEDDNGANPTSFAPEPSEGETIARIPNGVDTNLSGDDFQLISSPDVPTPMAANPEACVNTVFSGVVINEFLFNPSGTDTGHEWIEIMNTTADDIDVSGWKIQAGTSSFATKGLISAGVVIPAGGYLLIGEDLVAQDLGQTPDLVTSLSLGNASNVDGIRLIDCNEVTIDTVLYGSNLGTQTWEDDNGANPTSFAPKPSEGESVARIPNGVDTNLSGDDFQGNANLTPWGENIIGSSSACANTVLSGIVINEILYNPAGDDADREWIELKNTTEDVVDISGWEIQAGTSSFSTKGTVPNNTFLPAGGYYLIGDELVQMDLGQAPDLVVPLSLGNASSSVDGIRLIDCNSVIIDTVLYGNDPADEVWEDDNGSNPTSFGPKTADGETIGRIPDGIDTNLSGDDFAVLSFPTPWQANDSEAVCEGQFAVKINEFLPNPHTVLDDGTEVSDDDGREWVELYNSSGAAVDLTGWKLQWGGSPSYSGGEVVLPAGTNIPANGFLLVGGELVENADVVTPLDNDFDMTLANSNGDALRLLHCGPGVADTVVYGSNNDDGFLDDDENLATSFAPKPQEGLSIARMNDGVDTNQSGVDFAVATDNTPGTTNPEIVCGEGNFMVKINEIFPNPDGSDGGQEFIELYNAGSASVRLDSWTIEVGGSSWSTKATLPPESELAPGEFYLIGEADIPAEFKDLALDSNLSLGNASSSIAGVRLINCLGAIEDTVLYGEADLEADDTSEIIDDQGGYIFVEMSESGKTIGRYPDGVDTDDNIEDFQTNMTPTPRASNSSGETSQGGTGTDCPEKTGCGSDPCLADGEEPSKCSHVGTLPSMLWMASLVVLWRRRE